MRLAFANVDYIFVVGCLGGGTGTGAMADLVEISRSFDVPVGCHVVLVAQVFRGHFETTNPPSARMVVPVK